MDDIWIEVTECPSGIGKEFFRSVFKPLPGRVDVGQTSVQFNLTGYVKHMIEQSKSA